MGYTVEWKGEFMPSRKIFELTVDISYTLKSCLASPVYIYGSLIEGGRIDTKS